MIDLIVSWSSIICLIILFYSPMPLKITSILVSIISTILLRIFPSITFRGVAMIYGYYASLFIRQNKGMGLTAVRKFH
jgi:hypothetical protein